MHFPEPGVVLCRTSYREGRRGKGLSKHVEADHVREMLTGESSCEDGVSDIALRYTARAPHKGDMRSEVLRRDFPCRSKMSKGNLLVITKAFRVVLSYHTNLRAGLVRTESASRASD